MSDTPNEMTDPQAGRRNVWIGSWCAGLAVAMVGASFAAVPLYRLFCQVTGYGGATQRSAVASSHSVDQVMTVRFDGNVRQLAWDFAPKERTRTVRIGENTLAFYDARNTSGETLHGTATFNVTPESAGAYFTKIECFCFQEQTLDPGQSVEMPVSFYIDPAILNDPDARKLSAITLSYTFFPVARTAGGVDNGGRTGSGG